MLANAVLLSSLWCDIMTNWVALSRSRVWLSSFTHKITVATASDHCHKHTTYHLCWSDVCQLVWCDQVSDDDVWATLFMLIVIWRHHKSCWWLQCIVSLLVYHRAIDAQSFQATCSSTHRCPNITLMYNQHPTNDCTCVHICDHCLPIDVKPIQQCMSCAYTLCCITQLIWSLYKL